MAKAQSGGSKPGLTPRQKTRKASQELSAKLTKETNDLGKGMGGAVAKARKTVGRERSQRRIP